MGSEALWTWLSTYLLIYWLQEGGFPDNLWNLDSVPQNWKLGSIKDLIKTRTFLYLPSVCFAN